MVSDVLPNGGNPVVLFTTPVGGDPPGSAVGGVLAGELPVSEFGQFAVHVPAMQDVEWMILDG